MNYQDTTREELISELKEQKERNFRSKKVEEELLQSKIELTTLMNNLPGMVYSCLNDRDWTMQFVSQGSFGLTGYLSDELTSKSICFNEIIHPDDREMVWEVIQQALLNKEAYILEYRIITKSGLTKYIWERGQGIFDDNSQLNHLEGFITDITERKQAEITLSESKDKYRKDVTLLNSIIESPVDIIIFSLDRNYCYTAFTKYHKETIKKIWNVDIQPGINILDIISNPEDQQKAKHNFDRALNGDYFVVAEEYGDEALFRTFYDDYYSPIKDFEGNIIGVSVFVIDVTKLNKAMEALNKNEMKYRSLYENMIDGSALHTLVFNDEGIPIDYRIVEVNPAFEHQLGISRGLVIGKTSKMAYGVEGPPYLDIYSRVALTGKPEIFETYFPPLDKYFSISVYCPYTGSFATIFENITERKLAEKALKESEEKYHDLFEKSQVGKFTALIDGFKLLEVNDKLTKIIGFSKEEIYENTAVIKFANPESSVELISLIRQFNYINDIEVDVITKVGTVKTLLSSITAYPEKGILEGSFVDITDRKQTEAELKTKNEQLKELNATKDKFFSIIAHDLRGPFNGILGLSKILKDEARNLDIDSIVEFSGLIYSSALLEFQLLENLLEWAKMQQKNIHFEPKIIIINNLINNEIIGLKYTADQKNITLKNDTLDEIIFTADEKMLASVLRNLISNAIKFTPKKGKINIIATKSENQVVVSVSDTGIGIKKENIGKLFKSASNISTRGTENEKGSGLGLLLCKEFVEKHGGKIWVESKTGKGSKFVFSIPLLHSL